MAVELDRVDLEIRLVSQLADPPVDRAPVPLESRIPPRAGNARPASDRIF